MPLHCPICPIRIQQGVFWRESYTCPIHRRRVLFASLFKKEQRWDTQKIPFWCPICPICLKKTPMRRGHGTIEWFAKEPLWCLELLRPRPEWGTNLRKTRNCPKKAKAHRNAEGGAAFLPRPLLPPRPHPCWRFWGFPTRKRRVRGAKKRGCGRGGVGSNRPFGKILGFSSDHYSSPKYRLVYSRLGS